MAYMTPEERISAVVGRGWRGLQSTFGAARAGTPQEGFNAPAPQQVTPPPAVTPEPSAKVKPSAVAAGLRRQELAPAHTAADTVIPNPPQNNFIRDSATGATVSMDAGGGMRWTDQAGNPIAKPTFQAAPQTGIRRVGNMDVAFDSSVSPAARAAFMADPVRPDGQIQRYQDYINTPRGRFFGATPLPEEGKNPEDMSIGEMVVAGVRQKRAQAQAANDLAARGQDVNLVEAGMRQRTADEQNKILAERTVAGVGLDRVQTQAAEGELAQDEEVRGLVDQYDTETDPAVRTRIKDRINLLTGRQEKQTPPHFTTEELEGGLGSRAVAIVPDASAPGGFRKVVPQEGGAADPAQAAAQSLSPEQRTKAAKLIKQTMTQEEKAEILRKVGAGEL